MKRKLRGILSVMLTGIMVAGLSGCGTDSEPKDEVEEIVIQDDKLTEDASAEDSIQVAEVPDIEDNLIKNGFFNDSDVSAWSIECGASKITACDDSANAPDEYPRYGMIDRDASTSSPYDCFAEDVTDSLQNGVTYDYEFYAMLSKDY